MKRVSLEELLATYHDAPYEQQYRYVMDLLERGRVKPVKASGTNGKRPALYRSYWLEGRKRDCRGLEEELKYRLHPAISVDYYLAHLEQYGRDRPFVLQLDQYLREGRGLLAYPESVNERSYEIWKREKFLAKEKGKTILKRCGLGTEFLHYYGTAEPLAYYSHTRETPQNLLILENKDTFYSMRRHLLDGGERILGENIGTLVYGAGKRIIKSFADFDICVEPYMADRGNAIYYFGDLDYEGIGIYEKLAGAFAAHWEILPFVPAYEAMFRKAGDVAELPDTSERQNRNISDHFFSYFSKDQNNHIKEILTKGKYIPQEILNISDF